MVFAILKLLWHRDLPRFFFSAQNINLAHYVTDGPRSQYKSRFIFWLTTNHSECFGCQAVRHYLETGHGKGPCDGVGGSLKRNAHTAASSGSAIVCNAPTMFLWAKERPKSTIEYCFVDVYDYWTAYYDRSHVFYKIPGIPGTRKIHSLMRGENFKSIYHRETTCSCDTCPHGTPGKTCNWRKFHFIPPNSLLFFSHRDTCEAPLCVCLGKIAALQKKYLDQKQILKVSGNDVFPNCSLSLLLQVTHLYIYNLSLFFQA